MRHILRPAVPTTSRARWLPLFTRVVVVVAIASAFGVVVARWRLAERREHAASLLAEIRKQVIDLHIALRVAAEQVPTVQPDARQLLERDCARQKLRFATALASGDEVEWILDDIPGELRRYRAACPPVPDATIDELSRRVAALSRDAGTALDRAMISDGIAVVRPKIAACGDRSSAKGMVKVHVRVAPDGKPRSVVVSTAPEPALGECVRRSVMAARFPKTDTGGAFSYPFVY